MSVAADPSTSPPATARWWRGASATRVARVALACLLVADAVVFATGLTDERGGVFYLYVSSLPLFVITVWLLASSRLPARRAAQVLVGAAAVFQIIAVSHRPLTSDDDYRFMWDAKVQLAGIDPYDHAPQDQDLRALRDDSLFPSSPCPYALPDGACTRINRPQVHTIYPPVAEAAFTVIRVLSAGGRGEHLPIQLAAALGCLAVTVLLIRRARSRGLPLWIVAVWAWCPLLVIEYGNAGHIDWLGVLLAVLALSRGADGRPVAAGLFAGAAIAVKLYPAIIVPSLLRRRPLTVISWAVGLVALSYVPHVVAVGSKVIGFLPGYLREEHYDTGARFKLLSWVVPAHLDAPVGAALLTLAVAWALWRTDPRAPADTAVVVTGVALLVATPSYGWYSGLLLALVVLSGAVEWLPVALIPTLVYLLRSELGGVHLFAVHVLYLIAAVCAAAGFTLRRLRARRGARVLAAGLHPA